MNTTANRSNKLLFFMKKEKVIRLSVDMYVNLW